MVSDVLSEAVADLEYYLKTGWYNGEIKEEIIAVKTIMNSLRIKLDTPPEIPKKKKRKSIVIGKKSKRGK